jgi:hypothetical protein
MYLVINGFTEHRRENRGDPLPELFPFSDEQKRRAAEAGDVAEAAPVDAMDPPGRGGARRTRRRGRSRLRPQRHAAGAVVDLVEDLERGRKADRMQGDAQEQYRIEGCFLLYGDPSPP